MKHDEAWFTFYHDTSKKLHVAQIEQSILLEINVLKKTQQGGDNFITNDWWMSSQKFFEISIIKMKCFKSKLGWF